MNKKKEDKIIEEKPMNPTPPGSFSGQSNEVDGVLDVREERIDIRLEKTTAGLGLSIAGGLGSTPFKGDDVGVFVSKVTEKGPAEVADLRVGDKLISVNGQSLVGAGHYDAVEILLSAGPVLNIVIIREMTRYLPFHKKSSIPHESVGAADSACSSLSTSRAPSADSHNSVITSGFESTPGLNGPTQHSLDGKLKKGDYDVRLQTVYTTLIRDQNGLGFSIAGGKGCPPFKENSEAIYISRITEGGAAEKDGKLQVGDRIVSINGIELEGARHDQAVTMLTVLDRFVRLVAEREVLVPKGSTPSPAPSPALDKQSRKHVSPKPFISTYNTTNSYIASSKPVIRSDTPTGTANPVTSSPPRPAPRKVTSQSSTDTEVGTIPPPPPPVTTTTTTTSTPGTENVNATRTSTSTTNPPPTRTKAITNEEFQAMIPAHFLKNTNNGGNTTNNMNNGTTTTTCTTEPTTVTLTIKAPNPNLANGIEFPDPPTALGKVTETITKSTFTETVVTRVTDNKLADSIITEDVTLVKDGGSLGFSIIGGIDHSCIPFGGSRPGIFISHIVAGGIAASSGKLRMGDRIIKAFGEDLTKCKHQEAVMTLLKPSKEITLTVQHDPLPEGFQDLTITRQEGEKLGMHIKGGLRGHRGNPLDRSDEGVFISKINSGGAAKRDARLKVGMRLLEVNGVSLLGASHQEAVNTLRNAGLTIHLVVCKGYDKSEVDKLVSEGKLSKENKSASHSVSSLDKEDEDSHTIRQEQEMKQELVAWEKEEQDKKDRDQSLELEELKDKSTPEKVMDVVHAAEVLALGGITSSSVNNSGDTPTKPKSPGGPKSGDGLKTTTIVMSKHTLAPQAENNQTVNNTSEPKTPEPKASVSDKKKFFEKAMEEHHQPSPKPERVFTFLSQDEVEKLKQEEEKKIALLAKEELSVWSQLDEDCDNDDIVLETAEPIKSAYKPIVDGLMNYGSIRTAKAERRMKERLIQEGLLSDDDEKDLSPAEQRALKAEKRAAWRQARLKSLEQDALQAQMVIKKMSEMIDSKTLSNEDDTDAASIINNNKAIMDHENNLTEVETTREKIISLELSTPERDDGITNSTISTTHEEEPGEEDDDQGNTVLLNTSNGDGNNTSTTPIGGNEVIEEEDEEEEPTSPTTTTAPESDQSTSSGRRRKKRKSKKGRH